MRIYVTRSLKPNPNGEHIMEYCNLDPAKLVEIVFIYIKEDDVSPYSGSPLYLCKYVSRQVVNLSHNSLKILARTNLLNMHALTLLTTFTGLASLVQSHCK